MDQTQLETYEKYTFVKDTMIQDTQFYVSVVEFKGYDVLTELSHFTEIDSIVSIFNMDYFEDVRIPDTLFDFRGTGVEVVDYNGLLLSKYPKGYYEAIGDTSISRSTLHVFPICCRAFWLRYNGKNSGWSINDYDLVDQEFLCYERDGKIIYQNPAYTSCWPETVSTAQVGNEETALVASPLRGTSLVRTAGFDLLRLVSASGSELLRIPLQGADMYTLDASSFPAGNYILVLSRADGSSVRQTVQVVR